MNNISQKSKVDKEQGLVKAYVIGFVLSVILTMMAYFLVEVHLSRRHTGLTHEFIVPILIALAFIQLFVQLFFFLHMGREKKPYWNLTVFISFISVIFIIVAASLWIMGHLNYNMMPSEMNTYLLDKEGIHK